MIACHQPRTLSPHPDLESENVDLHLVVGEADLAAHNGIIGPPAVVKDFASSASDVVAEEKLYEYRKRYPDLREVRGGGKRVRWLDVPIC